MTSLVIPPRRGALLVFFVLVFALSWAVWIMAKLATRGIMASPIPLGLTGMTGANCAGLVAILLTAVYEGRSGLRTLFRRLRIWRVGIGWYLFALLWPVARSLLATGLALLAGYTASQHGNPFLLSDNPTFRIYMDAGYWALLPITFIALFLFQLVGNSLFVQLGWRGYALPRLQARVNSLWSSVILGVLLSLWLLPQFVPSQGPLWVQGQASTFARSVVSTIITAVLYTWVFNNTRESLWPIALLHTSFAITPYFLPAVEVTWLIILVEAALVAAVVLIYGPARLARRPALETETA